MTKSRGNLKKVRPFLGRYEEINITYDLSTLSVEADGRTKDGFYENILSQFDLNDPQSYAFGVYDAWSTLFQNIPMSVTPQSHVLDEGYFIDDPSS